jgi:Uma2 family endonuclease
MSTAAQTGRSPQAPILYPESDGLPIADYTRQFEYIATIKGGLDGVFKDDPNVFVAGDLFWYPVEGDPTIRAAPDTLVAFGRPRGHRRSYLQWEEGGIAPQVTFEILSPSNRPAHLIRKFQFYERYGVEEYYVYDPDHGVLEGWLRQGGRLQDIATMAGWISPRLKVRFELAGTDLELFGPDGRRFATYLELVAEAEKARQLLEQAQQRVERLAAQLRELGAEPEA